MYYQRPKKENNECQTDLQCTPFILSENETAKVQSSQQCQTEIQLSPRADDTELYKIIPYIDEVDIERNAVRLVNIPRNRKIKLHFMLPLEETESQPEDADLKYVITDGLEEEVTYVKENEYVACYSNDSFHKNEIQKQLSENLDSVSSIGTLKSAIKKILREDDSTQTDLMIAPHILNDNERATITMNSSCQTSVTCSPRTSLTEVVPMLKSYWGHQGETREAFNKSKNVLEILKEIIQDVINIHQHMFDPNYNLPNINPVLAELGAKNSPMESSEWSTVTPSKTTKKTIMDVSGDGSFDNETLSELDSTSNIDKNRNENDFKQSEITSISTISEVTTLRSSDFTLTSTKDDDDADDENDDDDDDDDDDHGVDRGNSGDGDEGAAGDDGDEDDNNIDNILNRLKKKYTSSNNIESENLSNVKLIKSEPSISSITEDKTAAEIMSNTNNSLENKANVVSFAPKLWSENNSIQSLHKIIKSEPNISTKTEGIPVAKIMSNTNNISGNKANAVSFESNLWSENKPMRSSSHNQKERNDDAERDKCQIINTDCVCSGIKVKLYLRDKFDNTNNSDCFIEMKLKPDLETIDIKKLLNISTIPKLGETFSTKPFQVIENWLKDIKVDNHRTDVLAKLFDLESQKDAINADICDTDGYKIKIKIPKKSALAPQTTSEEFLQTFLSANFSTTDKEDTPFPEMLQKETFPNEEQTSQKPDTLIPSDSNESCCECDSVNEDDVYDFEHKTFPGNTDLEMTRSGRNPAKKVNILERNPEFDRETSITNYAEKNRVPRRPVKFHQLSETNFDANLKKPEVVLKETIYKTKSCVIYKGHIYQTDSFLLPDGSCGSDESPSNIIEKIVPGTSRRQPHTISYEEHMYTRNSDIALNPSGASIGDQDCVCAQKTQNSKGECPHCFKRIGPQYGLDQRGLNADYDQPYDKDPTDYCSTTQSPDDEYRKASYLRPPIFISNITILSSNSKTNTEKNIDASGNLKETNNDTSKGYIKENVDASEDSRENIDSTDNNDPSKYVEFTEKIYPTGKIVIGKMNTDHSDTIKLENVSQECGKCTVEEISSLGKIIPDRDEEQEQVTLKTKFETRPNEKLNENLTMVQEKPSLDTTIEDMEETDKATSKTEAKLNETSNENLTMATIKEIGSSKDELVKTKQNNAKLNTPYTCSAACSRNIKKSDKKMEENKMEEKKSINNLQNKCDALDTVLKESLSSPDLVNKDSHIASTSIQPNHLEKSSKNLTSPKNKCSTCKKSIKPDNTVQVIHPAKSKSLLCTCINSKCRLTQNTKETVSLEKQNSTETCTASTEKPVQILYLQIYHNKVKDKLKSLPEVFQQKQNYGECPRPPDNSVQSNCKCKNCILYTHPNNSTNGSSKCLKLPYNSIQKIFEKNLPCACSSSSTNQKDGNSDLNLDYLTKKMNPCTAKCSQNNNTPNTNTEIPRDKIQNEPMLSEQNFDSDSKNKDPTKNTSQMEEEKLFKEEIRDKNSLSTLLITTQPRVRILDVPKYIYKSYSSISNGEFLLDTNDSKTFFVGSVDNMDKNFEPSKEEANVSESDKTVNAGPKEYNTKLHPEELKKAMKTMNIHKLDGKYSVFSIEKNHEIGESQTTVYILPNAIFSSLLSIPAPHFLRERSESEIDDIIQFAYIRNVHYERNSEFDQITNATNNSEEFINIIADQNLPSMNCAITCSCSSSVPKSKKQQTDKIIDNIKADKTTSITSLQESENKAHISLQNNSVGTQSSLLFDNGPRLEKTSFASILKPANKELLYEDNVKLLENPLHIFEPYPMKIMGKYITWQDLICPNLCNRIPIKNASLESCINYVNLKKDRDIQTSNVSFMTALSEPFVIPPLTIEASTSTESLEKKTSVISPSTSDSSILTENKIHSLTIFPVLTLEASTSTTSRNEALIKTEELGNNSISLANITSPGMNLIEEVTAPMSKYETFVKTSTSKLPTNKTSSIPLTRISSPYEHIALKKSSVTPDASTSKMQTNIGLLIKSQETSTNDISSSISSTKCILSNISWLHEPSLSKLANVESYSQIPLPEEQISCLSLPKVESFYSITESNCGTIDTDTNDLSKQEWLYPEGKEIFRSSSKFLYNTYSPSEPSTHSKESFFISVNSKYDDISASIKKSPVENQPLLKSELVKENNEQFEDKMIPTLPFHHSINSGLINSMEVVNDKSLDTKLFSNMSSNSGPSKFTFDKYHNSELQNNLNKELEDFQLKVKDFEKDAANIPQEYFHKNSQLENLISRAKDAYTAYLTLKKEISSNFDVSNIDLPYQDPHVYSEYTEENKKSFLGNDQPIRHDSREHTDDFTSNTDDYYSPYLERQERISSSVSDTNVDSYNDIYNSRNHFISKTKQAYSKKLQRKEVPPKISVSNIYSSFEHILKDFQTETNPAKNSPNYGYSLNSGPSKTNDFKQDSFTYKNKEQKVSPLSGILKKDSTDKNTGSIINNYRDLRSDKFILKKGNDSSVPSTSEELILNRNSHNSTDEKIIAEKDINSIEREYSEIILNRNQTEYPRISRNSKQRLFSFKNEDNYLRRSKKEEILSLSSLTSVNDSDLAHNSIPIGVSNYTFNLKKDDHIITNTDGTSLKNANLPHHYSNNVGQKTSKDLKSDKFIFNTKDNYSAYPMEEDEISEKTSSRNAAPPYQQSISRSRGSRNLKSNYYSTYLKEEESIFPKKSPSKVASSYLHSISEEGSSMYLKEDETISRKKSTSKIASPYPHSIMEKRNSRDLKSNKYIYNPESRKRVSSSKNLKTEKLDPLLNYNLAKSRYSATSKLSSFVRNGTTNALLRNVGDPPQQLSMETIHRILPEITASSHRVLAAVQTCEQRLEPIKSALKDIKMKLKELNMPEVNGILQNDQLIDENNTTYIYLPPPPPPLASSRCSYRTKMTFQLKKPINPLLSVTANVNPFSVKHKYILNDADTNQSILTNYSSVSDPSYYLQRTSMDSLNPNFNQPSYSENKPLHPQRYHTDTYIERLHTTRKPIEVSKEDLPSSLEDPKGRKDINEFQKYQQYMSDNYDMYYYRPRSESLNNYVVFPPDVKSSKVHVPVKNSYSKTDERVFNNHNI